MFHFSIETRTLSLKRVRSHFIGLKLSLCSSHHTTAIKRSNPRLTAVTLREYYRLTRRLKMKGTITDLVNLICSHSFQTSQLGRSGYFFIRNVVLNGTWSIVKWHQKRYGSSSSCVLVGSEIPLRTMLRQTFLFALWI